MIRVCLLRDHVHYPASMNMRNPLTSLSIGPLDLKPGHIKTIVRARVYDCG